MSKNQKRNSSKQAVKLSATGEVSAVTPAPAPAPQEAPGAERAIGTVRVTATTLNVRREASASSEVVAQVRKGEGT